MIRVVDLVRNFGDPEVKVLRGINFEIPSGAFVSITGRSGSGKSTLLYALSTLDQATSGKIYLDEVEVTKMSEEQIHFFRNQKMGFVFQFHYLLPELTALENVLMPTWKSNQMSQRKERAQELLNRFGLKGKESRLPKHLSGGEQQRVAIARSLILEPRFIFADEPTGNLDTTNGEIVMSIFKETCRTMNTTIVYVTHDIEYAKLADQQIHLVDGQIA